MANKLRLAAETALIVLGIAAAKVLAHHYGVDSLEMNALVGSMIAGGVFIIGFILAGTLSDFKECEKIPAEMVAALESIYEEGRRMHAQCPSFDLDALRRNLLEIVDAFRTDLADVHSRQCLASINRLCDAFTAMEACGLAPNYIVRLKTEQGSLRRLVLRVYHIQRTDFVPSAYVLVYAIMGLILALVVFVRIEDIVTAVLEISAIAYLFIYLVKLLRNLDKPFRPDEDTMDDVSRFLLKEFAARLRADAGEAVVSR